MTMEVDAALSEIESLLETGNLHSARSACDALLAAFASPQKHAAGAEQLRAEIMSARIEVARGNYLEALRTTLSAAEMARGMADKAVEVEAILAASHALQGLEDHARAIELLTQAEKLCGEIGKTNAIASVWRRLGVSYSVLGRDEEAQQMLSRAVEEFLKARPVDLCHARFSLLNARARATERTADAVLRREALGMMSSEWSAFAREMAVNGFHRLEAMALGNAGIASRLAGSLDDALVLLQSAVVMHSRCGLQVHECLALAHIGAILLSLGRYDSALRAYTRARDLLSGRNPRDAKEILEGLASTYEALGRFQDAFVALKEAKALGERIHDDDARIAAERREQRAEIARLSAQWSQVAEADALTGLANRRAFDRRMTEFTHGALLLIDIDYFKSINDRFGHPVGDKVLAKVATCLGNHRRIGDVVARTGGEEFAMILPNTTCEQARLVAERLRAEVEAQRWADCGIEDANFVVTVSIGAVAVIPGNQLVSPESLYSNADRLLYEAKKLGRNRVASQQSCA